MSAEKKYTWHKIASSREELHFGENGMLEIRAGDKTICVVQHKEALYGCAAKCPHAGGRLAEGYTDALGNIVCPLHRYRFSLANGRNTSGEGYFLKTYPIELREDGVYAGIEEKKSLFGW